MDSSDGEDIGGGKSSIDVETEVSARIDAAREAYRGSNAISSEQSDVFGDTDATESVNGDGFALNSSGGIDFGEVTSEMGLPAAPIRMNENSLEHIESRHGDEIRGAGFNDAREFVEYVSSNFTRIKEGTNAEGSPNGTYLLQVEGKHNDTLYVEFRLVVAIGMLIAVEYLMGDMEIIKGRYGLLPLGRIRLRNL